MSVFLPLLLAGALVSSAAPSASTDDKLPRHRGVVVDTAAHRLLAADLVARAKISAEGGALEAARAQLLVANTMLRESGGLEVAVAYSLVHIDYALERYVEAGDLLNELADQSVKRGNVSVAATAVADAAEMYNLASYRTQTVRAVTRLRVLLNDSRIPEGDRAALRKRLG